MIFLCVNDVKCTKNDFKVCVKNSERILSIRIKILQFSFSEIHNSVHYNVSVTQFNSFITDVLGKLLKHSELQFPYLKIGDNTRTSFYCSCEDTMI